MPSVPADRIDPRALKVWLIHGLIKTFLLVIILGIPTVVLIKFFSWPQWVAFITTIIVIGYGVPAAFFLPRLQWRRWRYEVREEEIDLQRGVFFIRRTIIPMARVQHVDTRQGVVMRLYGLAGVAISTAAGVHEIPALSVEAADELRHRISRLARVTDSEL